MPFLEISALDAAPPQVDAPLFAPLWAEIPPCQAFALYAAAKILPCANGVALSLAWAVWHSDFDPHERGLRAASDRA